MGSKDDAWTTIESDPGVFTELIEQIGVTGVQVEELWSLDAEALEELKPVYGLIFLFKWRHEKDERPVDHSANSRVFFAQQVVSNACATQAILSVLLNSPGVQLGPELTAFKEFTADFPPELKGLAISNSEAVRTAHNSFMRPEPLVPDDKDAGSSGGDVYHFIAYVAVEGVLYELDGLKEAPIALGEAGADDWLSKVRPHIQARIQHYSASEIRFNLMAIVADKRPEWRAALAAAIERRAAARHALDPAGAGAGAATPMETEGGGGNEASALPSDPEALAAVAAAADEEIQRLEELLAREGAKRAAWRDENIRRRHNYIPFLFNFLKLLAEKKQLGALIERAAAAPAAKKPRQAS